jgi:hypothetical protein
LANSGKGASKPAPAAAGSPAAHAPAAAGPAAGAAAGAAPSATTLSVNPTDLWKGIEPVVTSADGLAALSPASPPTPGSPAQPITLQLHLYLRVTGNPTVHVIGQLPIVFQKLDPSQCLGIQGAAAATDEATPTPAEPQGTLLRPTGGATRSSARLIIRDADTSFPTLDAEEITAPTLDEGR